MGGLEKTEADCAAVAKDQSTRVTLADIKANIKHTKFFNLSDVFADGGGVVATEYGTITQCVCVLQNGFVVIGKSACADPANYNYELGCNVAYEDAIKQIWPLMGYAKRTELGIR